MHDPSRFRLGYGQVGTAACHVHRQAEYGTVPCRHHRMDQNAETARPAPPSAVSGLGSRHTSRLFRLYLLRSGVQDDKLFSGASAAYPTVVGIVCPMAADLEAGTGQCSAHADATEPPLTATSARLGFRAPSGAQNGRAGSSRQAHPGAGSQCTSKIQPIFPTFRKTGHYPAKIQHIFPKTRYTRDYPALLQYN